MNISKNVLNALVDVCSQLYDADSDSCTLNVGVPDSDMELEVTISYRFVKDIENGE